MTSTDRLRVALIGPGRIATAHLEAVSRATDLAELVAVAGLPHDAARTRELAARYGAERVSDDPDEVIDADDIDAVVLTVPNHVHAPLTERLVEAGKHVLIEKPLAISTAEADGMIEAARKHDRIVMVGQCRRFFEGARQAKEAVAELGRPLTLVHTLGVFAADAATDWWRSAADTGGLALGLNGPHVVDTMLWLVGSRPTRVYAQTRRLRDLWEGEDEAVLTVDFADGSLAVGYLSLNTRISVNDRLVNGPAGSLRLVDDRTLWVNDELRVEEPAAAYLDGDASFERQFREFAAAVSSGRAPMASAEEVRPVVVVLEAARASAGAGRPVDLDL